MTGEEKIRTRVDQSTYSTVNGITTSKQRFLSDAIDEFLPQFNDQTAGRETVRNLISLLNKIGGITEETPECHTVRARMTGDLTRQLSVKVNQGTINELGSVTSNTGWSQSEILRNCVFGQLNEFALEDVSPLQTEDKVLVIQAWSDIRNALIVVDSQFHDVLLRRFVELEDVTKRLVENEPNRFELFARRYHNKFYGRSCYEQLVDRFGPETFNSVEEMIEDTLAL